MESNGEKNQECSIKIDMIWSEAEESLLIKEEIVSDLEPDSIGSSQDNSNNYEHQIDTLIEDENSCNGYCDASLVPKWQPLKKKVKSRSQRSEESEMIFNHKLSCPHDTKNFKIVKRRLRCGDCRSLVCPECCQVMIPNLQSHFLGYGVCSSGTYFCKLCSIIFHSLCALQAHIRIHTMDTPYVCPDCGLIYNNIYFLILHLLNKCYHVYKIVRYKCKQCPGSYFTPETFLQHIQERHIHCVFRCLYCSSLFSYYDEFNCHMENHHQKQKVQYLNYVRCSLCSDMVIPRFMYQRHVAQHRENSEFYEVDYQCLCGETYSLIGAFRSHFSYCSKKGMLPPKWSFLQRKLRTHDVHPENFQNKEVAIQPLPVYSNNDADFKKLTLVRPEEKILVNDKGEVGNGKTFLNSNCTPPEETNVKKINSDTNEESLCKKGSQKLNEESDSCSSCKPLNNSQSSLQDKTSEVTQDEKNTHNGDSEKSEAKASVVNEPQNTQPEDNCSQDVSTDCIAGESSKQVEEKSSKVNKELEQSDGNLSKIYDHIPCDHLGYVIKSQCIESSKKPCQEDDIVIEKCFSPKSYKIVTELDEKTGVITTKTVPLEEIDIDEEEEEEDNTNEDDCDMESINFSATAKQYCNDKAKFKVGNSLSCPFCIVLFPKHNLTFQQFRLHLESYHPDAALNITVSKDLDKIPEKVYIEKLDDLQKEAVVNDFNDSKNNDEGCLKTVLPGNLTPDLESFQKELVSRERQNEVTHDSASKTLSANSKENIQADAETVSSKALLYENDKPSLLENSVKHISLKENICQSEKPSVDNKDGKCQYLAPKDCREETVSTVSANNSDNKELDPDKKESEERSKTKDKSDEEKPNTNVEKVGSNSYNGCFGENLGRSQKIKELEKIPEPEVKTPQKTLSDLEYEGETSKDSNWSGLSSKDTKIISSMESKVDEKESSRRESEVWSEFYESLMLAEKLKKKKNPSPESDSKKKSVVSDYSSKRVVKKPKRYRESSESGDSNEFSESDEEFLLENDFMDKIYAEEKSEPDIQVNKKQMLLNKLENVDGRFVDYLFDLVTKKEKLFELYKKHSALRANRYSHDLRSYRKKVLNGIKQRGRPLKILRYHELIRRKELTGDKNNRESFQSKKNSEFSPENKANERKRGRPRKYHDPAKLKERRRSDKEVDFIEKNFEREESDFSPSKRKRKLSSKLQYYRKMSDEKDDFSSGQVITNKPADSSKKFTCAVCKEVFPELTEFREHIVIHRMEENTYQCMECGECFVVRPSLEKHLHAFHKIKNTDKYITDNHCCNIKKEIIDVDNEPLKENQCKVCKDQFDRPIDLTKHFRIHGMAFLKEFKKEGKSNEKRSVQ